MGMCIHYVVYFNFSGISYNICPELYVLILVKLRRWEGSEWELYGSRKHIPIKLQCPG